MKKMSLLLIVLSSEIYPLTAIASSDEEIRDVVKPCIDKIVSTVDGSGDGFSDDDLIKCASDLTRHNSNISISKAIAIVGFYAGEAYKPDSARNKDNSHSDETEEYDSSERKNTVNTASVSPRTAPPSRTDRAVMNEKDDVKDAVVGSSTVSESAAVTTAKTEVKADTDTTPKAVVVSANRLMTDYELNEEKADDEYKYRRMCIKGKISKISVLGDTPFVEMSADSYGLRNVKFTLDKSRVEVLDSLQVGDIKVIEGTVVGYTLFKVSVTDPVFY